MRILFLSNFFPPHELGGYAQLCNEVAVALHDRGHDVHILTSHHGTVQHGGSHRSLRDSQGIACDDNTAANRSASTQPRGLEITRSLHLQSSIDHYHPIHFLRHFQAEEQHNQRELRNAIERFEPEIVFVWGMWNLSLRLPYLAESLLPGRVAYYLCSYWPEDQDIHLAYWNQPANRLMTALLKKPLTWAAHARLRSAAYPPTLAFEHVACVSQYVRERLINAGVLPPTASVIYNGGDLSPFYKQVETAASDQGSDQDGEEGQSQPLRLLYFGRLITDKGAHTAFEALTHLRNDGCAENLQLTVLGDGRDDYISYLRRYAVENGIDHLIHFNEGVPRDEVPNWLHKHDVFLFTSMWAEPLARSVMEAMMAGLLVIGSEVGGQKEMMIDGVNALTFQAEDAVTLAKQIKVTLGNRADRLQMAKAGQQMVMKQFTQKRMVDEMEAWLESIAIAK